MDTRKPWSYRGCQILPEVGEPRYFGSPNWPHPNTQYKTRWWKIVFPDQTWTLAGYISTAKDCIDRLIHRHLA